MKKFITKSSEETIELGKKIGLLLNEGDVLLLEGDLSGGKTTFTKGIGISLGVTKIINSPTFTIVKTYKGRTNLYHLDLYRLDGLNNDFDLEDYIETDGVAVIEWPHQVDELLPKSYLSVKFERTGDTDREITVEGIGKKYEEIEGKL